MGPYQIKNAAGIAPGTYGNQSSAVMETGEMRLSGGLVTHTTPTNVVAISANIQSEGNATTRRRVSSSVSAIDPSDTQTETAAAAANTRHRTSSRCALRVRFITRVTNSTIHL